MIVSESDGANSDPKNIEMSNFTSDSTSNKTRDFDFEQPPDDDFDKYEETSRKPSI